MTEMPHRATGTKPFKKGKCGGCGDALPPTRAWKWRWYCDSCRAGFKGINTGLIRKVG